MKEGSVMREESVIREEVVRREESPIKSERSFGFLGHSGRLTLRGLMLYTTRIAKAVSRIKNAYLDICIYSIAAITRYPRTGINGGIILRNLFGVLPLLLTRMMRVIDHEIDVHQAIIETLRNKNAVSNANL